MTDFANSERQSFAPDIHHSGAAQSVGQQTGGLALANPSITMMTKSRIKERLAQQWPPRLPLRGVKNQKLLRLLLLLPLLLALLHASSCKKNQDDALEGTSHVPMLSNGITSNSSGFNLSYAVSIQRSISFLNGLNASSPAWKKLQAVPETESYSFQVSLNNGDFYMLQDNILTESVMRDRLPDDEKIAKIELSNGVSSTYNAQGKLLNSEAVGEMGQTMMRDVVSQFYLAPVNLSLLTSQGVKHSVSNNRVTVVSRVADGDDTNSVACFDLNTGLPLLLMAYDDIVPNRLRSVTAHQYDASGNLQKSAFTTYDYLSDGDTRRKVEQWTYSNFSLTFQ